MFSTSFLLFVLSGLLQACYAFEHHYYHPSRLRAQYEVYLDKNGSNFLQYRIAENLLQGIPDDESACEILLVGVNHPECLELKKNKAIFENVTVIPDSILSKAVHSNISLPLLGIHVNEWNSYIDELMRTEVNKFKTFLPPVFMKGEPVFVPGFFHGNQVRMKGFGDDISYFAVWRNVTLDTVNFGLLHTNNFTLQLFEDLLLSNRWNGKIYSQQEARVAVLTETTVFVICTSRFSSRAPYGQMYGILQRDVNGRWKMGPPVLLDYNRTQDNKNFVPLFHGPTGKLYLIPSLNPLVSKLPLHYHHSFMYLMSPTCWAMAIAI